MSTTKAYSPREINRMTHRVLPWGGEWADGIIQTTNDLPLTTNDNGNGNGQID